MSNEETIIALLENNNLFLQRIYSCLLVCIGAAVVFVVLYILWTAIKKFI